MSTLTFFIGAPDSDSRCEYSVRRNGEEIFAVLVRWPFDHTNLRSIYIETFNTIPSIFFECKTHIAHSRFLSKVSPEEQAIVRDWLQFALVDRLKAEQNLLDLDDCVVSI